MKKWIAIALTVLMIVSLITPAMAQRGVEENQPGTVDILSISDGAKDAVRSIDPGPTTPVHEYRFYKTKEDAINAQTNTSTAPDPINIQIIKTHGALDEPELVEIDKKLFEGWYVTYNGTEHKVVFDEGYNIREKKTLYAYPKYEDVSALFFAEGRIILGTATADGDKHISKNDEPNVMRENKILKGWSLDPDISTWEAVVAAGKNFQFKEDTDPTEVDGSVVVYAVLEKAYRINYDTDGGTNIDGYFLGKDEIYAKVPPDNPEKEGYTFDHWYVIEKKLNPATGQMEDTEITLTTKTVGGELVFDKEITKSTVIYAKYTPKRVKFGIVFMREKRPDQIKPGTSPYEFLGYFSNHGSSASSNLQKTEGLSGSTIIFDDQSSSTPEQVTNLDKNQFQSYLEQTNNNRNLLKYASPMGIEEELLKGFHVNKEKTNEVDCILKGNGLTTKLVYLDRDTVNLRVYKSKYQTSGNLVEDENSSPDALGNFKYGESIKVIDANRGWNYLIDKYNKGQGKMLQNYLGRFWYTIAPFATENAKAGSYTADYMQRDGDSWKLVFVLAKKPSSYSLLSVPIKLPLDKQNYNFNQGQNWLKDAETTEAVITDSLLPNKENPAISDTTGWWSRMTLAAEDYAMIDGYECINGVKSYNTSTGSPGYKDKLCNVAGVPAGSVRNKYIVAPVFYKKKNFDLRFESGMTGTHGPLTVSDIPYDSVLVGPAGPEGGDPNIPAKELEIEEYLSRFTKAIIDPQTKDVTNYDEVTKNGDGHLFMGWYLDPGYMLPFDEHMPMPAHNMQVFAKWEPYTHYVKVHKLSKDSDGVDNPNNIIEIEINHNSKLSEQNPKLKYTIPAGSTEEDFLGWETYGDVNTQTPSTDGDGAPFEYVFDNQVKTGFHLYPKWKKKKARVVYVFNYDNFIDNTHTPDRPLTEDEIKTLRDSWLDYDGEHMETDRYYMSKFQYDMDTDLRLRDPLGMDGEGFINHPVPPAGTAAEGKVFLGWKIFSRNYKNGTWTRADTNLYYYNSPFTVGRNNISYSTSSGNDNALGALFLVAVWGDKDAKTEIKLFANNEKTPEAVYFENNLTQNEGYTLPDVKTLTDTTNASLKFEKEGYQFKYWTTNRDGSGIQFRNQQEILIDNDLVNQGANELYAQWMKLYDVTADKEWKDDEGNTISNPPKVAVGLLRRVAVGPPYNPGFGSVGGFTQVPDSLKVLPDDAGPDGKLHWKVEGHNDAGERYAYITVELKPEGNYVSKFYNATSMDELGVWIDQEGHRKYQNVELGNGSDVDVFTSATMRSETNYNATTNIAEGYLFKLTNTKVNVPAPVVEQGYVDETSFDITPGLDPKDVVTKIIVTIPGENTGDPEIVLTLEKTANGSWSPSDTAYGLNVDDAGKITIQLPSGRKLKKDEVIKAHAENKQEVKSKTNQMTVKDAEPSVKPDKPVQQVRDDGYNVVITSTIPTGATPDSNTVYTLVDSSGNDIKDSNDQPIVGLVGTAGTITFKVPDGILHEDDQVKVRAEEPRYKPTLSDLSDPLDINPATITVNTPIHGVTSVALNEDITITEPKNLADVELTWSDLPDGLDIVPDPNTQGKATIQGTPTTVGTTQVTLTTKDKYGNISEKIIEINITAQNQTAPPTIQDMLQGDSTVGVTPPASGADTLYITFPDGTEKTLTKDASGNWKDGTTTLTVNGDGAVEVPVPTGLQLKEGDIIKAQAEDKANTKAKSPIVTKAVGRSKKKTPTPTLEKITAEDTTFIIKPIDNPSENIITDTLVVTIKDNSTNTTVKKIILKKQSNGNWRIQGTSTDIVPDGEGKLTVDPGLAFKAEYSLGATAEDKTHGHSISDPTSVKVNAKQSDKPSFVEQLKNDDAQTFYVFKGKGVPGALINIYSPGGDQIAIPVTVGNDGFFEAKIPQDNMPADGKIQFAQKIEERPESEKVDAELKITKPTLKLDDLDAGATIIKLNNISNDCTRIIVTLPDDTTKELTKNNVGNWLDSNNKVVGTGPSITDLDAPQLKNNDIVKAVGYDKFNNISKEEKTIVGDKASFATEKPQQEKRDDSYNVIISAVIPAGSNPADNTEYTLCKEDGTEVTATITEKDGKVVFTVADGVLAHSKKVKVKVKEPGKPEEFSDVSEALDLNGPVITAQDIKGRVGVPLKDSTTNQIKVEDEASPGLEELTYSELPQKLQIVKDGAIWKVKGAVPYKIEAADNVTITYIGIDQWGNKTEKIVNVLIEDKTAVDTPKIDPLKKGSKTVKITPPLKGDTLVVTIGDDTVTLTKDVDSTGQVTWSDGTNDYIPSSGKIDVKVPDDEGLEVGDIVTAQGKDSTKILADSPIATDSVKQSNLKTPTPQFEQVTVGDTTFTIEPINQGVIVVDRLVITIRNETTDEAKLILTKDDSGNWTDQDNNPITKEGNKLKVSVPSGITLTSKHSFGATAEDVFHGHAISDPTSINVNAKQSDKPTAEQGKTKENGNPTITGTGVAGADINVYDPTTGDLIAGPVKVKPDGTYEIEVPKDSVPDDGKVIVKQKEDGKPESEPTNVTIDKTAPDAPVIDPTNVGDTAIQITPPDEAEKLIITLPDGSKKELTKKDATTWTDGATDYPVNGDKISLPVDALKNNDIVKAIAEDAHGNQSPEAIEIVGESDSFAVEKPVQEKRDATNHVIIRTEIPAGSNPAPGTKYTLCKEDGTEVTATVTEKDGKLIFTVADGVLTHGEKVKVKAEEPGKTPKFSDLSEELDLVGPVITANDVAETVNIPLEDKDELKVILEDDHLDGIELTKTDLPVGVTLEKIAGVNGKPAWQLKGTPRDIIKDTDNFIITYTATDKFGNTATKEVNVVIIDKEVVDTPLIDTPAKGDNVVTITPPTKGDTLVVTIGNEIITLTKNATGNWSDGVDTYIPDTDGKIEIPTPATLEVGDIIQVQGKDSTGKLEDSIVVKESVKPSNKKTPMPTLREVKAGSSVIHIKPNDELDIKTDRLVITFNENKQNQASEEKGRLVLTKDSNGQWTVPVDSDGFLEVNVPSGIVLTPEYSIAATGEDSRHGHIISDPTSIKINARQSEVPTGEQDNTNEKGQVVIKGTGIKGSIIQAYDKDENLIGGPVAVNNDGTYSIPLNGDFDHEEKVFITQKEDGKPDSDKVPVVLTKDVIPSSGNTKPNGYYEVTLDPTSRGSYGGERIFYVNPDRIVKIPASDPTANTGYQFKQWDELKRKFTKDETIKAQYKMVAPEANELTREVNTSVTAEEFIINKDELPANTTFSFESPLDVTTVGTQNVTIIATSPEGDKEKVETRITFTKMPTEPTGDTIFQLVNDPELTKDEIKDRIILPNDGRQYTIDDFDLPTNYTTSTVGEYSIDIAVHDNAGHDYTVTMIIKVVERDAIGDAIPSKIDGSRPVYVPTWYVKVKIDPTEKGDYQSYDTLYVNPRKHVKLPLFRAIPKEKYLFTHWSKTEGTFQDNERIVANYDLKPFDPGKICPPCPTVPDTKEVKDKSEDHDDKIEDDTDDEPLDWTKMKKHDLYMTGMIDGTFGPEKNITRAEVAMIFARILSEQTEFTLVDTNYSDVDRSHWASGPIAYLTSTGIMTGLPDGRFAPNQTITRAEYAVVLARVKHLTNGMPHFRDVAGHWAEPFINAVADAGYVTGYEDGSFRPNQPITRAEAVVMTNRMLGRTGDLNYIQDHMTKVQIFPDVSPSYWAYKDIYVAATTYYYTEEDGMEIWHHMEDWGRYYQERHK